MPWASRGPSAEFPTRRSNRKLSIVMALSATFTQCAPETTKFCKITQNKGLSVINTKLPAILHRLRDIAFEMSKIAIFGYPSCV